ncbi:hypothetical protein pipiens_013716 [Culex pipiens pipiens]|uniref:Ionotropic glutamate receptor C-terminal domain-containing protein n=1 Tax=Culex pipiens pipiens TaxID=38569 RepID=A0ABD1CXD6_CULPP
MFFTTGLKVVLQSFHNCPANQSGVYDPCYYEHLMINNIDMDCMHYKLTTSVTKHFHFLVSNWILVDVLLVPRSQLEIVELFMLPLHWTVWLLIVTLLVAAESITKLRPTQFCNDPILLVVCGFERRSLHRAKLLEKTMLVSLIILMFFTMRAYETKLLSVMVNKPSTGMIRTEQDLLASGIKIKSNLLEHSNVVNDAVLGGLVVNSTETIFNMDMIHAHVVEREMAEYVLPMYYDHTTGMPRYSIMDQPLGYYPRAFMTSLRNPLKDVFAHTLNVFIECGLIGLWSKPFCVISSCFATSNESPDAVEFIVSTIEALSVQQTGVPSYIVYDLALGDRFAGLNLHRNCPRCPSAGKYGSSWQDSSSQYKQQHPFGQSTSKTIHFY